jgi:aminomethyltransferase
MDIKKTPFYSGHIQAGGRMVDFAGWHLPLEYESVLAEAKHARIYCGLFDASHMGQIRIKGQGALDFLQKLVSGDLSLVEKGRMQYNLFINHQGGVIDDLMVYNMDDGFLCVVNASNLDEVYAWLMDNKSSDIEISNESDDTALLSLQGPNAAEVMKNILGRELEDFKYMSFIEEEIEGRRVLISRSGYTGEDGFEMYINSSDAQFWWDLILDKGKEFNLKPCGLGARDILRIEAGYPLYGHEIDARINPFHSSLGWAVKLNKEFVGRDALLKIKEKGITCKRVGFMMEDKAVPRQGYLIYYGETIVGTVTSGTYSPNLNKFIGMALLDSEFACLDTIVKIKVRDKFYKAKVVSFPFVPIKTYKKREIEMIKGRESGVKKYKEGKYGGIKIQ